MVASLIQDTIQYLKTSTQTSFIAENKNVSFFKNLPIDKKPTPQKVLPKVYLPDSKPAYKPVEKKSEPLRTPKPVVQTLLPKKEKTPEPWKLEPTKSSQENNFAYIEKQVKKALPDLTILKETLDDLEAKKIANRWKLMDQLSPITIFSTTTQIKEKRFLENLSRAIGTCFLPCRIINPIPIERENQWVSILDSKELQFILACDFEIASLINAAPLFKKTTLEKKTTLGNIPILLLPDLKVYFKDSSLKRSLWKTLCQKLPSLS